MKSVDKKNIQKNIQKNINEQPTAEDISLVSVVSILRNISDNQKSDSNLLLGVNEKFDIANKNILTSVNRLQSQVAYSVMINNGIKQQTMICMSILDTMRNMNSDLFKNGNPISKTSNTEFQETHQPVPDFNFTPAPPEVNVNSSSNIDITTIIENINNNHLETKTIIDSIDKSLKTVNRQIWFMNKPKKDQKIPVSGQPVVQPVAAPTTNNTSNVSTSSTIQNITNQQLNVVKDKQEQDNLIDLDEISFNSAIINLIQTVNGTLIEILDISKQFYDYYQQVNNPNKIQKLDNEIADSKLFREGLNLANRFFQKDIKATTNKNEFTFTDKSESTVHGLNNVSNLISATNTLLAQILSYSKKIYEFLPNLSSNASEASVNQGAQSKGIDLSYLVEEFQNLDKSLTTSFLKNFAEFNKQLDSLLGIDSKKFLYTKISLTGLSFTFKLIAGRANDLSSSFKRLTFSILLVSLALISPPFLLGATVLIGILWGIRKALTGTNILFGWNLRKLSWGILTLVGALWLLAKMPYPTLLKAIGLISILAIAVRAFGGKHEMSFNSKTSGIFGLAIGVLLLSLAFNAFGEVPVANLIKMIGFIAGLGLTINLFPIGNRTKGMFGFSVAMVLLTLAIDAFGELPILNMVTILGFIAGLGLVFRVFPVGNRMKGMLGFAFGMTLLILAVDAAGEVPLTSYVLVLGFVGTLLGEIFVFNKLNRGRTTGIFGLALGLAILILAVDAAREVPFSAYSLIIMFVGSLLTILSLYNKQGFAKTSGLMWIAGFVTTLSIAFAILQKVGLKLDTVMAFVIGTGLISGLILWLGTPGFNKRIISGSKNMLIISGVVSVTSIAISFASQFPVNLNNIINFTLGVGILSALLLVVGVLEKPIKKGAIVLGILAVSSALGAIAITMVSSSNIDIINILKFAGAVGILGLTVALLGIPVVAKFVLIGAAVLLGMTFLLGLSMKGIKAVSDYKINFSNIWRFLGAVSILATGIILVSPLTLLGSFAVIPLNLMLLGLIPAGTLLFSISLIKVNVGNIALLLAGIAILSTGIGLLSPVILVAGLSTLPLLAMLSGCLVASILLSTMSFVSINFKSLAILIGTIGLLAIGFSLLTPIILIAGIGALFMLPIIGASMLIALTLSMINGLTFENVGAFLLAITGLATSYALITPLAIVGIIGAILTMPIMLSALWTAAVLKAIMELELSNENIDKFSYGLTSVVGAINSLGLVELAKGVAKALMLMPIMLSALWTSAVLFAISKLELNPKNIGIFNFGLKSLVDTINDFGVIELTKGAAKALLLLPIMGSMLLASLVLKAISELEIDPKKMDSFGNILTEFVDVVLESLDKNQQKLIKAQPAMEAFAKLVNIPTGLVNIIKQMADMRFNEYEVQNGKMVLKRIREFKPEDFVKIGKNLAAMLNALIEPLTIIGANTPTFKIGGVELSNPFVKSKAGKGVEFLGKLGAAFKPLVDGIYNFARLKLAQDINLTKTFITNLLYLVKGFNIIFRHLNGIEFDKASIGVTRINEFIDSLSSIKTDELGKINKEFDTLTNNLSTEDKWNKINKNLIVLKNNFLGISKAINSIDLEKATALNRGLAALSDKNNGENIRKLVEEFSELIGLIRLEQEETKRYREIEETKEKEKEKTFQLFNGQQFTNPNNPKEKKKPGNVMEMLSEIGRILVDIKEATSDTADALGTPLKVIPIDVTNNAFGSRV